MLIVPEALIAGLVTAADAFAAIEAVFAAMARGEALQLSRGARGTGRRAAIRVQVRAGQGGRAFWG